MLNLRTLRPILWAMVLAAGLGLPAAPSDAQQRLVPNSEAQVLLSFAPVVKQAAPAVVNIFSKRKVQQSRPLSPLFDDPFFKRFFGDSFGGRQRKRIESSLGSGVIVSSDRKSVV